MDSRAKQRLTGAVILVALFVLLVPELLTGPRKSAGDTPSEDGMRHYTIDLDASAGGAQPATPAEPAGEVSLPPVAENPMGPGDARAVAGEAAQPEAATPAPIPTPTPAVITPMATPPQSASNPAPPVTTPKPAATAPRPAATSPAPAETARADAPRGGFAVQLGSFVSKENAERLVREMTAKGFNAFLAPPITTGGRELWRVRVGPARDRAAAEALATQLRRIGQAGSVVSIS